MAKKSKDVNRVNIRFSGSGGQGLIRAGIIYAEAAAIFDGKNAVQTQSYGPEARGGASQSEVVISNNDIDYPKAMGLDLLLCLTQEACDKYYHDLAENGLLVVDSTHVKSIPTARAYSMPFTEIARKTLNKPMVANVVALGAISALAPYVSVEAIKSSIKKNVPPGTEEINLKAFEEGLNAAKKLLENQQA